MNELLKLQDGRDLNWADNGIESDQALILHHGTLASFESWKQWMDEAAVEGIRAIAINRPGVNLSTRNPGRTVKSDIDDLRELLPSAGVSRFVSIGWSGGAARAIGSGLLPECIAIHTIAGIAPLEEGNPDSETGIPAEVIERVRATRGNWEIVRERRAEFYEADLNLTYDQCLEMLGELPGYSSHESEYKIFAELLRESIYLALKNGVETDADDYYANSSDWGFNLDDIPQPLTLWHGELDKGVEIGRSEFLSRRMANATVIPFADQDHVDIFVEKRSVILAAAIRDLQSQ